MNKLVIYAFCKKESIHQVPPFFFVKSIIAENPFFLCFSGNLPTSLSDDEKLARYLQQQDECKYMFST